MALAAERTKRMTLATGVAIPSNRIEPVTAHSIATINLLAPGRTVLGVGTGFTGRNTMGLPPVPLERLREYVEMVRKLLRGEEVLYRDGKRERWIRFLHQDNGVLYQPEGSDTDSYRGRRHQGAGTGGRDRRRLADRDGRGTALPREIQLGEERGRTRRTLGCPNAHRGPHHRLRLARRRVDHLAPRVIQARLDTCAIVMLHALWEQSAVGAGLPGPLLKLWERYRDEYAAKDEDARRSPPPPRCTRAISSTSRPGEDKFVDENLVRMTLTGRGDEIIGRLKALEAEGLKQVAIQVVKNGREMIEEFSREVIAKY